MAEKQEPNHYEVLAQGSEELKENLRVMLAACRAEGFTDEQAHEIATSIFRQAGRRPEPEQPDA